MSNPCSSAPSLLALFRGSMLVVTVVVLFVVVTVVVLLKSELLLCQIRDRDSLEEISICELE